MQQLQKSCQESYRYPLNLPPIYNAQYDLRSNHDLLCTISSRTFADESKAALEFWEQQRDAYIRTSITCHQSLRDHLNLADQHYEQPPLSCFVFLEARSSRTRLLITRDMLTDLLTYFQVMAGVVPMVASFGCDAARDYQHCQLESAVRLQPPGSGIAVPELNRSGRMYEIAYVFRTVERSENVPGMPWQIKQTCIYHNFDVVTGLAVWIMIKGSDCLRRRLTDELSSSPAILPTPRATERCAQAFGSTFNVQAMCADLSVENWRWYINFLEQEAQTMTRVITFKPVVPPTTTIPTPSVTKSDRSAAVGFVARARTLSLGHLSRSSTLKSLLAKMNITESTQECKVPDIPSTVSSPSQPALSFVAPQLEEETYFETLQSIKGLEERAFEARLVLKTSIRIWDQLQRTYDEVISDEHFPESLRNEGKHCFSRFRCRMRSTQDALENQVLRVDTLITLLAGRKALVIPMRPTGLDCADSFPVAQRLRMA